MTSWTFGRERALGVATVVGFAAVVVEPDDPTAPSTWLARPVQARN